MTKTYLGDGAYAEFDGYSVELTTSNGIATTNRVVLEPELVATLLRFLGEHFDRAKLRACIGEPTPATAVKEPPAP